MSQSDLDKRLMENYMKKEIDLRIKLEEELKNNNIVNPELQNYYMQNGLYDYIYPFGLFFQSNEKIPNLEIYFRMNYRYLYKLRYHKYEVDKKYLYYNHTKI